MFPIGSICICHSIHPDGQKKSAQVRLLEYRDGQAYVHFEGSDTRLDRWVPLSSLSRSPLYYDPDEHPEHSKRRRSSPRSEYWGSDSEDNEASRRIWNHGTGHEDAHTKVRNIQKIQLGEYEIDAWYFSPYPPPYDVHVDKLYICEETFKYMKSPKVYARHLAKLEEKDPSSRRPPGIEIYRDTDLSVFRIEGTKERLYCQNLCLLGKLFIEHKTLHYDPSPFYFFLIVEKYEKNNRTCFRPVGYFSKEKQSNEHYNLACILTLPPHQRKGVSSNKEIEEESIL